MKSIPSRALLQGSLLLGLLATSAPAFAEATPEDRASADQLYNDATKLMAAGNYADACPKLGASQRLDPAIGTLLKLGFCFTYTGQTASAWASFNDAEAMARKASDKGRAGEAAKRAHELEAKLSKLVIESSEPAVEVRRDGLVVDRGVLGSALPVDPGAHAITASAAGKEPWSGSVTVEAGPGTTTVRVPALAVVVVTPAPPSVALTPPASQVPAKAAQGWSTQRKVGLGVGAAGLAGVVVGSVFGVMTLSKVSATKGHCSTAEKPRCDAAGFALFNGAGTTAKVSDVTLAVGGAAVIAGAVLFITASSAKSDAQTKAARVVVLPTVGAGATGVVLQGAW